MESNDTEVQARLLARKERTKARKASARLEGQYTCRGCGKVCNELGCLYRHMRTCKACDPEADPADALKAIENREKRDAKIAAGSHKCGRCGRCFTPQDSVTRHSKTCKV